MYKGSQLKATESDKRESRGRLTHIGTGERFALIGSGMDFLYRVTIALILISTINKVKFIKLKFFCTAKDTTVQAKQPIECGKL